MYGLSFCSSNLGYEMYDSFSVFGVGHHKNDALFENSAMYRMCCVISGEGYINHVSKSEPLMSGDVLVIPPTFTAHLCGESLEIVSVGVKGREMNNYSEDLGFVNAIKKITGLNSVVDLWKTLSLPDNFTVKNVRAKGVVLYTISEIYNAICGTVNEVISSVATRAKNYIDGNFTTPEFALTMIGKELSYHPNYISKIFKKEFGINVAKYISIARIRHSLFLIEEGETSVKSLAQLSGFIDEEYFSSVFKKHVGENPREYIKRHQYSGSTM